LTSVSMTGSIAWENKRSSGMESLKRRVKEEKRKLFTFQQKTKGGEGFHSAAQVNENELPAPKGNIQYRAK